MKSAVAVMEVRKGYKLLSILVVAFMTMLMVGMLGARSASADPGNGNGGSSSSNGNANGHDKDDSDDNGNSDEDHGNSDEDHGKPDSDDDSDDDEVHGNSDKDHGKPDSPGKSKEDHGNGKALGHEKNKHAEEEVPVEAEEEPAAPVSNESKAGEIVLGARENRGGAAVAPAQVAGASSGAALPFTGPEDLIPFLTAAFGLMGSGGYLLRKNSK